MEAQLLATKLFVPQPRPGLAARPRLMERLQSVFETPLTLVSAPAGFGKTTVLAQWIAGYKPPKPVAWVSLDDGDNDPVRFWNYFIAAIRTVRPEAGESASTMLRSPQPYPIEATLTALINDISAGSGDVVLVLDDYHVIQSEPIGAGIAFLAEHLPASMHLVIATRTDPELPLPRFRGRGMMLEMRADDLRFTADEAGGLLAQMLGREVPARHAATLSERTEGWAAGLRMAALSLRGRQDVEAFLSSFAGDQRYVMDYLVDEVLKQQRPDVREFLLTTSLLEKLSAPLCDAVTGRGDSRDMLVRLESSFGGFLLPLDESRQWYRYHHLFGDLLRHQLRAELGAEEMTPLHQRASRWYEENQSPDDAIRHALVASDWHRAMTLIEAQYEAAVKRGEWDTLFGWYQAIPDELLRNDVRLYGHYANVLITRGSLEAAESVLGYLEKNPNVDESLRGELAFFRMSVAYRQGDMKRAYELGETAVEQLTDEKGAMRARAVHILAVHDVSAGRLDVAQSREVEAMRIARRVGESWIGGTAAGNLSFILWLRGKVRQALTTGEQAVEMSGQSPGASWPHGVLGFVRYEWNELEEAARSTREAVKWSEVSGYLETLIPFYHCLAQSLLAGGKAAEAEAEMAKGDEASRHPTLSPLFRVWHAANRVMFSVQRGDLTAAEVWGRRLEEYPADMLWIALAYVPARLLIAMGGKEAAAEQLRGLYERTIIADMGNCAIKVRVYQALVAATQTEALTFLTEALEMGQPEGFIRTFVDEGKLLKPLLRVALSRGIMPEYTTTLLAIIEGEERDRKTAEGTGVFVPAASAFMSQRELEVLKLVADGLSNQQIAQKLTISLNTAKTHIAHVFGKLNAKDRLQAVKRARELKLI